MLLKQNGEWRNIYASPLASAPGVVYHENDSTVARPSGYAYIIWRGQAEPNNAATDDIWIPDSLGSQHHHDSNYMQRISADVTYQIPSDYPDLQTAIDSLANELPDRGVTVTLNIETGHALTDGIAVSNGDYSMFRVTSDDAEPPLDSTFPDGSAVVFGDYARLPRLACLINGNGQGNNGYFAFNGSVGHIEAGAGIKNIGALGETPNGAGIFVLESSTVSGGRDTSVSPIQGVISTGNPRNLWVSKSSRFDGDNAEMDDATGAQAVFITRSCTVEMQDALVRNAANVAIESRRSIATVIGANVSNAGAEGLWARFSGTVVANDLVADNCTQAGLRATATDVSAQNMTSDGCDQGIEAEQLAKVDADGAALTNAVGNGILASKKALVNLGAGESSGSGNNDLAVLEGAEIAAVGATTTNGTPAVGDTNVGAFNAIDANNGIIWA